MVKRTFDKKAQVNLGQIPVVILGFISIVIVLAIAGVVITNLRDTGADYTTVAKSNESFTGALTAVQLARDNIVVDSETLYNRTFGICTKAGNYTMNYYDGKITCLAGSNCCRAGTGWLNITYSWNYYGASWNASKYGLAGITTLSENLPIIAVIIVMGLVLVILFGVFANVMKNR